MAPMLAPSLRASSLCRGTPIVAPRSRVVRVRAVRRTPAPVQALFGFGKRPSQSSQSQRVTELEDEVLSIVRGSSPGGLSPNKQEEFEELVAEAGSLQGRNALKDFEGTFKFIYNSRPIGAPIAKFNFVKISYEDGTLGVESSFALFGIFPGSAKRKGPIKMKGPNKFTVTWEEAAFNAPFINAPPETGVGGVWVYNILYSGPSICIFTAQIEKNIGKTEPVLSVCERILESDGDQSPSTTVGAGRKRSTGLATRAERKYEQQVSAKAPRTVKKAAKPATSDEEPAKKSAGLFGGFFAPPRYPDAEEAAPAEPAKQDSRKIKARGKAVKEDPAQAKRAAAAKAKAAAAAKAKAEAEKKAAAEAKAKAAAAAKAQAEAERAAAQKKKEEISTFLNQLADDLKAAQQETRASSDTLRTASRENMAAVKEAQAAQNRIDAAEASVNAVEDEIEQLISQEQEINERLRDAQRELQKLRA